ncbi:hypothetical protein GGR95_003159 [Sulfitobacter undariae]|uniref:YHYH domain-containing protein n=1 Tax=Sulfitobacter undariae TaxID=1563671 RepID=A0A7W6EC66_9RHOB|nr:YHYH protein [Sulfitobacter undariae]MBB3995503.1 hypothetical protein [Sulfitobacter undariae]
MFDPARISPKKVPVLIGFMALAVSASGASAHDITDAILTDRAATCADYVGKNTATGTDVQERLRYTATIIITKNGNTCSIASNAVPNHDFNATGRFANPFSQQKQNYTISAKPRANSVPTALSLRTDNAIFLNGVKLDLMAAGCFGVRDGRIGCGDMDTPYRYDPMGPGGNFGTDEHNAHTQPDGTYHYHGNPLALFEQTKPQTPSPVIGFAADGFPIFGSYIDDNGAIRPATTSYQLKTGTRSGGPGGRYDGTFIDDWEFVAGSGDLDQCNGMMQNGVYGYVVTATYPHVLGCFTGTPDASFNKRPPNRG